MIERIRNGQGGYNCGVYVDPKNPDIVYTINTSSYKSTDGGNTFTGFKGAPGGDDPQQMWIDPTNGQRILLGLDQGAVVSLDGGATWSSWYNQSTEQVYHISVDNSFPYWVYATQQDAGAVRHARRAATSARSRPLDWNPVSGWEWGTIVPDPLDPNIVYASGSGIVKITYPSEQWINVSPATDPTSSCVRRSRSRSSSRRGISTSCSPDSSISWRRPTAACTGGRSAPISVSPRAESRRSRDALQRQRQHHWPPAPLGGAIETISPSSAAAGTIWVGTNNGLIKLTRDEGKTWQDVSIPNLPNRRAR